MISDLIHQEPDYFQVIFMHLKPEVYIRTGTIRMLFNMIRKRGDQMDRLPQKFVLEACSKFAFLEELGYKKTEGKIVAPEDFRDTNMVVQYIGKSVGVEIYWYFAGANIGVVFFELQNGELPENKFFFGESNDASKAISLYYLARYLGQWDDELFLLNDVEKVTYTKIKKREKVINERMSEVLQGLSCATRKYATNIINGDTSVFNDVMKYYGEKMKEWYGYMRGCGS